MDPVRSMVCLLMVYTIPQHFTSCPRVKFPVSSMHEQNTANRIDINGMPARLYAELGSPEKSVSIRTG